MLMGFAIMERTITLFEIADENGRENNDATVLVCRLPSAEKPTLPILPFSQDLFGDHLGERIL